MAMREKTFLSLPFPQLSLLSDVSPRKQLKLKEAFHQLPHTHPSIQTPLTQIPGLLLWSKRACVMQMSRPLLVQHLFSLSSQAKSSFTYSITRFSSLGSFPSAANIPHKNKLLDFFFPHLIPPFFLVLLGRKTPQGIAHIHSKTLLSSFSWGHSNPTLPHTTPAIILL